MKRYQFVRYIGAPFSERYASESTLHYTAIDAKSQGQFVAYDTPYSSSYQGQKSGYPIQPPKSDHLCGGCGKAITKGRTDCAKCAVGSATERLIDAARMGRIAGHTPEALARKAESQRRHAKGLPNRCIQRQFKPCSLTCPPQRSQNISGYPGGTRVALLEATVRIHGIGKRWLLWRASDRTHLRNWGDGYCLPPTTVINVKYFCSESVTTEVLLSPAPDSYFIYFLDK